MNAQRTPRSDVELWDSLAPAALLTATAVLLATLVALGDGVLAAPPAEPEALQRWATSGDPLLHAAAIGRLVALAGGTWVLVATIIGLAVRLSGSARGITITDRWSPALVRRCIQRVGAATLAGTLSIAAPAGIAVAAEPSTTVSDQSTAPDETPVATMTWEPEASMPGATTAAPTPSTTSTSTSATPSTVAPPAPAARPVPLDPPTTTTTAAEAHADTSAPTTTAAPRPPTTPTEDAGHEAASSPPVSSTSEPDSEHAAASGRAVGGDAGAVTVRPGDHLWGIASATVTARSGADASAHEIAAYWLALIDRNAERFVEPGNPDLIVPGQVLVLP